ncbi:MAG: acyl transferase [Cytophagales bacterium]|nr:acyl transferase [Cytophagales bacterium]
METFKSFTPDLYPTNDQAFEEIALRLFHFQAEHNPVYKAYIALLGVVPDQVRSLREIPFLPITLFKTHLVAAGHWAPELTFLSSGTTGQSVSRHAIPSVSFYNQHSQKLFEDVFGPLEQYHVFCLLPSYLERTGSSLVAMASHFITESRSPLSGFFLNDLERLIEKIENVHDGRKGLLLGVTFALVDLAEQFDVDLGRSMVMETGGMKGRRPEIIREEVHEILMKNLRVDKVYSEYGMTELMSQAYSMGSGLFRCPPSMRVFLKEINDPFSTAEVTAGVINIIDLANAHSCAFIETQDIGRMDHQGHFEVLGRIDASDARGCNLLVE